MKKLHIKKGDTVYVNAGNDKGKTGKVLEVIPSKDRAIVEGINIVSKHLTGLTFVVTGIYIDGVAFLDMQFLHNH